MIYFFMSLIGIVAFFLKGAFGIGNTTVLIAVSSFLIEPKLTIVLAGFISVFGNIAMLRVDPVPAPKKYWIPIAAIIMLGTFSGAMLLKIISSRVFEMILGAAFILMSIDFILRNPRAHITRNQFPKISNFLDILFGWIIGFLTGFIGASGPPIVFHFGRYLDKQHLRRLMVLIFLPGSIVQSLTFMANGLFTMQVLYYSLALLPGMVVGIYLGNKFHGRLSEKSFRIILGIFLLFVSMKLLF